MVLIFKRLQEFLPSLNKRKITWRMIIRACRKIGAKLFCIPLKLDGYFIPETLSESNKPEIYVNANLSEDLQIATAVHEMKHAIFDTNFNSILFSYRQEWSYATNKIISERRKHELEACAMGAMALITERKLEKATRGLFDIDDEFIEQIWKIRLSVREVYGI